MASVSSIAALVLALQAAQPPPAEVAPVIVTPASPEPAVREFVGEVLRPAQGSSTGGQIGRWNAPICPLTIGSARATNAAIAARIRDVAAEVGAPVARGRCSPNIAVVVTDKPDDFLALFSKRWRFRFFGTADRAELAEYLKSDQPVRWWHTSLEEGASGRGVTVKPSVTEPKRIKLVDSRIETSAQASFTRALIVVDSGKVRGAGVRPVADFAAMVALAQAEEAGATYEMPTILNLFARPPGDAHRPETLSRLDLALLRSLYEGPANLKITRHQAQIATRVVRDLQSPASP